MAWIYLAVAAGFEVMFAMSMKYAEGFTRLGPTVVTVVAIIGGIGFLTLAMRTLPVSVAYPIWTAVGTLGTVVLGFLLLDDATLTPASSWSPPWPSWPARCRPQDRGGLEPGAALPGGFQAAQRRADRATVSTVGGDAGHRQGEQGQVQVEVRHRRQGLADPCRGPAS